MEDDSSLLFLVKCVKANSVRIMKMHLRLILLGIFGASVVFWCVFAQKVAKVTQTSKYYLIICRKHLYTAR